MGEYVYEVEPIPKAPIPDTASADNGLVELFAVDNNGTLLALERSFASGVGNTLKLFQVQTQGALDVSTFDSLLLDEDTRYDIDPFVSKRLIADLEADLGIDPDSVEGMTLGETLPDGRQSLILVSDNNFNDVQTTQFIALALDLQSTPAVLPIVETPYTIDQAEGDAELFGDSDDMAVWIDPENAENSIVIGTLKDGGLAVFSLEGKVLQTIPPFDTFPPTEVEFGEIRYNNVDLIYNFPVSGIAGPFEVDLAVASDRENDTLAIFSIDPETKQLSKFATPELDDPNFSIFGVDDGEATAYGLANYVSPVDGSYYVFVTQADGNKIAQLKLTTTSPADLPLIHAEVIRTIELPVEQGKEPEDYQSEAIVVDQEKSIVYLAVEDELGIVKFDAEPNGSNDITVVRAIDSPELTPDLEGLALYYAAEGKGYLIASSQGDSSYAVYSREGDNEYLGSFVVGDNHELGIDQANETDGLEVINLPLGSNFPQGGLFVQDGANEPQNAVENEDEIENNSTNFKFIRWDELANTFATPLIIDTDYYNPRQITFKEDFNNFQGNGFSPRPSEGQLNSNTWAIKGLSDGDLDFGLMGTTDDFARGTSSGGVTTGGIYAFEPTTGDRLLGVQPTGDDFTPGEFVLRLQNRSDTPVTRVDVQYTIRYFNDQNRANSLNFSFSEDNFTFTEISDLDFTTPETADSSPTWESVAQTTTISDLNIDPNEFFYLKWTGEDVSGSGSRDEYGIDDVFVRNLSKPGPVEAPIYEIQGEGDRSPLEGNIVTTTGVVTADFRAINPDDLAPLRGVFIQDADGDGNLLTSDGLFVFLPASNEFADASLAIGDLVSVTGTVTEDSSGNSDSDGRTEFTHLDFITNLEVVGTGSIVATDVLLPEATNGDLEQYEGMLVNIASDMTVSQNFFVGRYGQLTLSSPDDEGSPGRLLQPTSLLRPGLLEQQEEVDALADENQRRLLVLDDGQDSRKLGDNPEIVPFLGAPPPEVIRAGDKVENLVGVLDFGRINSSSSNPALDYRLQVLDTEVPTFTPQNLRQDGPDEVGGSLKIASFNVDNYFTTLREDDPDARGAFDEVEFERQQTKIFAALQAIDADIVGLVEIENNGFGPDSAIQNLVDGLNELVGEGTYAFINSPSENDGRLGTDAIANPIIYKPDKVTPMGDFAFLDKTVDSRFDSDNQRPALAQTFQEVASGESFTFVNNHFKSKGSPPRNLPPGQEPDPRDQDLGDGQGFSNFTRTKAAQALVDWLATDPTGSGDPDIIITGDLNAYALEDPIIAIQNGADGDSGTDDDYSNLVEQFLGDDAYSFVFDGQAGYLDHALASGSMARQVTGVTEWHINADEPKVIDYENFFNPPGYFSPDPFRSSDHDPLVIGLDLKKEIEGPIEIKPIGTYSTGIFNQSAAVIPAYDPLTQRLFVVNANNATVDVLDISDPTNPVKITEIDVTAYGGVANSVDVKNGIVAIAVENEIKQLRGRVVFFDSDAEEFTKPTKVVKVGSLPDMLTFTPDGHKVIVAIEKFPLLGMYQPDAIASYQVDGKTYLVTANEGDARDYDGFSEEVRVEDLDLDPTVFSDEQKEKLARLKVTNTLGKNETSGLFEELYSFGARSFSIWNEKGEIVFDSGEEFEQITAEALPDDFNSNNHENGTFDNRSDDKGPEPEGVTIGEIDGQIYAFIGLERVGGIMVYDITNPESPEFVQYLNNRDFSVELDSEPTNEQLDAVGDLGPEGLIFISADESPNGQPLLVVANEVSGTTTIYEIDTIQAEKPPEIVSGTPRRHEFDSLFPDESIFVGEKKYLFTGSGRDTIDDFKATNNKGKVIDKIAFINTGLTLGDRGTDWDYIQNDSQALITAFGQNVARLVNISGDLTDAPLDDLLAIEQIIFNVTGEFPW